jgi:hypothetical protein
MVETLKRRDHGIARLRFELRRGRRELQGFTGWDCRGSRGSHAEAWRRRVGCVGWLQVGTPGRYKITSGQEQRRVDTRFRDDRFEFQKNGQLFIHTHNETLSVAAMCICNPDRSPVGINR